SPRRTHLTAEQLPGRFAVRRLRSVSELRSLAHRRGEGGLLGACAALLCRSNGGEAEGRATGASLDRPALPTRSGMGSGQRRRPTRDFATTAFCAAAALVATCRERAA